MRATLLLQGAVWGLAGVLLFPAQDLQAQTVLAFVLAGIAAGSLTLTSFDFAVALGFAVLALAPLGARLLVAGSAASSTMAGMVGLFIAFLALAAWRAQGNLREALAVREAEARRAEGALQHRLHLQQVSDELARKSDALELTLASMDQGILSLGADGRIQFFNQRACVLLDLSAAFLNSRPTLQEITRLQMAQGQFGADLELIDEATRARLRSWLAGAPALLPPSYCRRTPSGLTLEVKTRYLPGGGLVRTFSDVTDFFEAQQRLQDSQALAAKLALVAAHTDNAVIITDAERSIEWVNEGFTRLTGYTLADVAGRRPASFLRGPGTDAAETARLDEQLAREGKCSGELLQYAKDGRPYWFAIQGRAIRDDAGQVLRYISVGQDVSARRAAEQALRETRDETERASRAKSEFLSAMSHELRTPMHAILGFAQLLETDAARPLPARQLAQVQQILRAGEHLLALINDVLDLARVEAGKQQISVEPVGLRTLMAECLALMRPLAREHRIQLDEDMPALCDAHVAADRTRLKQVLLNLLSNAIKYNLAGGEVRTACRDDGDRLRITVSDTGPGLGDEQRARLFKAFERLGAEGGPIQGAGIGLALSKRMVELMHGQIGIDSASGGGSTFWISLPRAQAPAAPGAPRREAPAAPPSAGMPVAPGAGPRTVLYIEDNPVNVLLMEAALEREPGLRLVTAAAPEPGLDLARTERPDLILLDIQLPGIDGFEVLRRLRAAPATHAIPVVAVSANAMPSDITHALAAGFERYLTKPLDIDELLTVVRSTAAGRDAG